MSSEELTDVLINEVANSNNRFFVANFANADMVGHTGSLKSGIKAVESLDVQLKKIADTCLDTGACLLVTADHGNIEQMISLKTGDIDKDHTTNPVPFLIIAKSLQFEESKNTGYLGLSAQVPSGAISDIASTVLDLMGITKPAEMTGVSLISNI